MNTPAGRGWDKVEYWSSYFLLAVLGSVILTRLGFATVWSVPTLDLVLGSIALLLILASPWIARRSRALRIGIVAYAAATQLVPMSVRHPAILLPLLGALIPVVITIWALVALSRKGRAGQGPRHT
ncbi:MAG: LrgA [Rhodanobacter sp. 68-29]|nr:LrgA [Rhodanobacter sp.]ODU74616.1 MAG: LrgA [Rhodanobacter sp. SCN 69-32]OJY58169.1 MAG: LrgA [Rhodanobacter sp. 68-29]